MKTVRAKVEHKSSQGKATQRTGKRAATKCYFSGNEGAAPGSTSTTGRSVMQLATEMITVVDADSG